MSSLSTPPAVLITGGALRLGAALCESFAAAGWRVICHYNHSVDAAQALQRDLQARDKQLELIQADLADESQRRRMMELAGPLQALVNNASLFEPDTGLTFDTELARRQLEVNLLAPLQLAQLLAQNRLHDPQQHAPCVIHILDQKVLNLNPDYFSYTISKLALERAVALQAQALAPHVRVCGIAPGLLFVSGPQSVENLQHASRVNLMRRPTAASDVAATAVFLAQNASITGATLAVDNGQHLVPLERDVMFVVDQLLTKVTHV